MPDLVSFKGIGSFPHSLPIAPARYSPARVGEKVVSARFAWKFRVASALGGLWMVLSDSGGLIGPRHSCLLFVYVRKRAPARKRLQVPDVSLKATFGFRPFTVLEETCFPQMFALLYCK